MDVEICITNLIPTESVVLPVRREKLKSADDVKDQICLEIPALNSRVSVIYYKGELLYQVNCINKIFFN